MSTKKFFNQDMKIYRAWLPRMLLFWRIIVYEEDLADPEDARRLKGLLAYLSGRRIQEFEENLDKLFKEGASPRIITKDTPAATLLFPADPEEVSFNRKANRAVFVAFLPLGLSICALLLFWIWWSLR